MIISDIGFRTNLPQLHQFAYAGQLDMVNKMLADHAEVNELDWNDGTAFMLAALQGHVDVMIRLAKAGAKINLANLQKVTATHLAFGNSADAAIWLYKNGGDLDALDNRQRLPSHYCSMHCDGREAGRIIAALDDDGWMNYRFMEARDYEGMTAHDITVRRHRKHFEGN